MSIRKVMGDKGLRAKGQSWEIMVPALIPKLNIKFLTICLLRMGQTV